MKLEFIWKQVTYLKPFVYWRVICSHNQFTWMLYVYNIIIMRHTCKKCCREYTTSYLVGI